MSTLNEICTEDQIYEMVSRYEAYYTGLVHYWIPERCPNGHLAPRSVATNECMICRQIYNQRAKERHPDKWLANKQRTNYLRQTDPRTKQNYINYMREYMRDYRERHKQDVDWTKAKKNEYAAQYRQKNMELYGVPYKWMLDEDNNAKRKDKVALDHYRTYQREYHRAYRKRIKEELGVDYKWMLQPEVKKRTNKQYRTEEQREHYLKYQREYHKKRRQRLKELNKNEKVVHGPMQDND